MKIILSIPLLALVVFKSINEGSCDEQPAPVVVRVPYKGFIMVPFFDGKIYGGGYHERVKQIPAWVRHPKSHPDECAVYVEFPDNTGYVATLKHLPKAPAVKGIKNVHAAVKVTDGFAIMPLQYIDPEKVPNKVVHTRVYMVTPQGKLMFGIITKKEVKSIKMPSKL
ncbi:uncharacterized protein LOC117175316 [Belonocnema kinseyi]|uniref:uncharacterized protein LOC117175316 n=1 Tax=Belonocnema kinseyi TaxID=2817044 RepID=UPI00143D363D|nr:uncharacterized protein LOC117175316 [Belonocnema kinseyi]